AQWTRTAALPAVLDFAFKEAVAATVAGTGGTILFEHLFDGDSIYAKGADTARILPTFTGNHDDGRVATSIRKAFPAASEAEILDRVKLTNALLLSLRGVPTIYSGDEQGFAGDGGDQDAREDMFASRVASYNDNRLVGTTRTTATDNFDTDGPLFRQIAELARIRRAEPALRRGSTVFRHRQDTPGLLAISRIDPDTGREVLLTFNTSAMPVRAQVQVEVGSRNFSALAGPCAATAVAPGSVTVTLPPLGYAICASDPT
ncbi:MAG: alpha-amylase, partial [Sphingomonadales bacterium]|nr:alpha-amylase [Sphingomonadales bacterium]